MKQVVLIGDSIRMGYQETVKSELGGVAEVWAPAENGAHTVNVLVNLNAWALKRTPDLVHINCGLHDLKTVYFGGRENVVPPDFYAANVERLLRILRDQTRATVIWATTTPIHEGRARAAHARAQDFDRYEADVQEYNRRAVAAAQRLGVPVNDLHAAVGKAGAESLLTRDGVHFTPEGRVLLGKAVAASIRKHL